MTKRTQSPTRVWLVGLLGLLVGACGPVSSNPGDDAECGNGILEEGEACDDGNTLAGDGCSPTCRPEQLGTCGDGMISVGEQCDDGNTVEGDGCGPTCQVENGWVCGTAPTELQPSTKAETVTSIMRIL